MEIKFPTHSITRNGIEIELTAQEIRTIHSKVNSYWKALDTVAFFEDRDEPCPYTEMECYQIGNDAHELMWDDDAYADRYWWAYYNAIDELEMKAI